MILRKKDFEAESFSLSTDLSHAKLAVTFFFLSEMNVNPASNT